MVQERPDTPEKQLLKLIENPARQQLRKEGIKRKGLSFISLGALRGRFSFFRERIRDGFSLKKYAWDIKGINRILQIGIVGFALYLIGTMALLAVQANKIPDFSLAVAQEQAMMPSQASAVFEGLSDFLEKVRGRDIFSFESPKPVVEEVQQVIEETKVREVDEEIKNLRLAGIAWSDNPDVMIEDAVTKEIYFVKEGQLINNKLKVERVFRDKVIVSYKGERAEME